MSMKLKKIVKNLSADDISQATDITGLKTDVGDLKTAVGDNSKGLVKKANDLETAIGDEDTPASILGRIKALETAANSSGGGDS